MKKTFVPTVSLGFLSLFSVTLGWVGNAKGNVLPSYGVTDLGFLDCGLGPSCDSSQARAISETGAIVGLVEVPDPHCYHAGLFRNGEWLDLGALGTTPGGTSQSEAHDINGRGQVVGSSNTSDAIPPNSSIVRHAFIWDEEDGMSDLGTLGSFTSCFVSNGQQVCRTVDLSDARAINDSGQVVGIASSSEARSVRPFIWDKESGMRDLGAPDFVDPVDINSRGQIAGNTRIGHAAILDQTGTHDLGFLDANFPHSSATAINNASDVVGTSYLVEGGRVFFRAFLWRNGVMKPLPLLPNDQFSQAFAVNDRGQVVGVSLGCNPRCTSHPVVWDGDDVIEIPGLEPFGFKNVTGINDRGQAVGTRQSDEPPFISRAYVADPR